jgi:hypothetical protein
MPNLGSIGHRFQSRFLTDEGLEFFGILDTPEGDREPPAFIFAEARRLLSVRPQCLVRVRDIFLNQANERYLVGSSLAADYGNETIYRVHRVFEVTERLEWLRATTTADALTGLTKEVTMDSQGNPWCVIEFDKREDVDRMTHIAQERPRIMTGAFVQEGDWLGGRPVVRVTKQLGLSFVETQ